MIDAVHDGPIESWVHNQINGQHRLLQAICTLCNLYACSDMLAGPNCQSEEIRDNDVKSVGSCQLCSKCVRCSVPDVVLMAAVWELHKAMQLLFHQAIMAHASENPIRQRRLSVLHGLLQGYRLLHCNRQAQTAMVLSKLQLPCMTSSTSITARAYAPDRPAQTEQRPCPSCCCWSLSTHACNLSPADSGTCTGSQAANINHLLQT
jgi:hypothetical protein